MTGNGTGPFHTGKLTAPVSHPMKPTLIPRAYSLAEALQAFGQALIPRPRPQGFQFMWACALVGRFWSFWMNWALQGCACTSEKEITFAGRKRKQAEVDVEQQLSTTWVCWCYNPSCNQRSRSEYSQPQAGWFYLSLSTNHSHDSFCWLSSHGRNLV